MGRERKGDKGNEKRGGRAGARVGRGPRRPGWAVGAAGPEEEGLPYLPTEAGLAAREPGDRWTGRRFSGSAFTQT